VSRLTPRRERGIKGRSSIFRGLADVVPRRIAAKVVWSALHKWRAPSRAQALAWKNRIDRAFPDQFVPEEHWDKAAGLGWMDFFTWGHDHDFGFGVRRRGAMSSRHIEIMTDAVSAGLLPRDLAGKRVLDIGCWSGGDLLVLAGMGAQVVGLEQHPRSARAARALCRLVGSTARIVHGNIYRAKPSWRKSFDVVYCSGVIYHVTDPILLLRTCFAYLKLGGTLIVETKSCPDRGAKCLYSGSREKGWNWFAPTKSALGRWLADVGFSERTIGVYRRDNGRLIAYARKSAYARMPDTTGFSRPGSWLESKI
jgi:2-polyprenyl-3-methyl-5-hydroxy-6-metoxy-1,4-benzoquinol methylase